MAYQCSIAATTLRIPAPVEDRLRSLPAHCEGDTDVAVAHGKPLEWNFGFFRCERKCDYLTGSRKPSSNHEVETFFPRPELCRIPVSRSEPSQKLVR